MTLSNTEFQTILKDSSKRIEGDIVWEENEDHSPCWVFRAEVLNDSGWPLFISGNHNPLLPRTSYHLIHRQVGRIYGLDHGKEHRNPGRRLVGQKHKHQWEEATADKLAYEPEDITAPADQPTEVWKQFCAEAAIMHRGSMSPPPPHQPELFA